MNDSKNAFEKKKSLGIHWNIYAAQSEEADQILLVRMMTILRKLVSKEPKMQDLVVTLAAVHPLEPTKEDYHLIRLTFHEEIDQRSLFGDLHYIHATEYREA